MGRMENDMETTIWGLGFRVIYNIRVILGSYGDSGKENGNYYNGLYWT